MEHQNFRHDGPPSEFGPKSPYTWKMIVSQVLKTFFPLPLFCKTQARVDSVPPHMNKWFSSGALAPLSELKYNIWIRRFFFHPSQYPPATSFFFHLTIFLESSGTTRRLALIVSSFKASGFSALPLTNLRLPDQNFLLLDFSQSIPPDSSRPLLWYPPFTDEIVGCREEISVFSISQLFKTNPLAFQPRVTFYDAASPLPRRSTRRRKILVGARRKPPSPSEVSLASRIFLRLFVPAFPRHTQKINTKNISLRPL